MYNSASGQRSATSHPILTSFFEFLPERPYCSADKRLTKDKRFLPKEKAAEYAYIQANHPSVIRIIAYDCDYSGAALRAQEMGIAEPSITAITPETGRAHPLYFIDPIAPRTASKKSKALLRDVIEAYKDLLCADRVITTQRMLVKNPLHPRWNLILGKEHTLREMAEYIPQGLVESRRGANGSRRRPGHGRNA